MSPPEKSPNMALCSPRRGAWGGPGVAERVSVMLAPAGILGRGTAHTFALGKAVMDEGRAAPEGAMVPQPQAGTSAVSEVTGQSAHSGRE